MKHDKLWNGLTAWGCGFLLSFGGAAAMSTGFDFAGIRFVSLCVFCLLFSGLCAWAFSVKKGPLVLLCLLAVTGGFALRQGDLLASLKTLTWQISDYYNRGYQWGVVPWGGTDVMADKNPALQLVSMLPALCITWAVCRRKKLLLLLPVALIPLYTCFVLTDTVPDLWCIVLLTAGVFLTVLTQSARRLQVSGGNRMTALALIPVLLISLLLPRIVPEEKFDQQMEQLQSIGNKFSFLGDLFYIHESLDSLPGATSDRVNLAHAGPILDLYYTVMTVEADFSGIVYLRQRSYDRYDGKNWDTSNLPEERTNWPYGKQLRRRGTIEITTRVRENALYVPYYAFGDVYSNMQYGMIPNREHEESYTFAVMNVDNSAITLWPDLPETWTDLPEQTRIAAQKILADNNLTTVDQIIAYVQNSAEYDKRTAAMPATESDFAIWFLEKAETGYCVHFATAAVVLLRAAGFNARYVTGYTASVQPGTDVQVTAERAHAWVELLDKRQDWVVLDPTPGNGLSDTPDPTTEPTEPTPSQDPTTEPTEPTPSQEPTEPSQGTQPTMDITDPTQNTEPTQGATGEDPDEPEVDLSFLVTLLKILAGAVALLAVLWGQYRLRRNRRNRQQHRGLPNQQALARWREIHLIEKLLKQEPEENLLALAEKARFSQHTLCNEELALLQLALNARQQALSEKPWYQRLWIKLILAL